MRASPSVFDPCAVVLIGLSIAPLACESEPQVEVSTRVGAEATDATPWASAAETSRVRAAFAEASSTAPGLPLAAASRDRPPEIVVAPPHSREELDALLAGARTARLDELAGPARNLALADARLWPEIRALLRADPKHGRGDYRRLLETIGGDVPNRYGHFALSWQQAHGHTVKLSKDWFADLLALPHTRVSSALHEVYRDTIMHVALLRAAANIGAHHPEHTGEVVDALLDDAYVLEGTFRDEIGRAIQAVGDEAVPHLLLASVPPADAARHPDTPAAKRADYATYNLDRMGRLHPDGTLAAVRDNPRLCAAVIAAYGRVRPGDAAPLLIDAMNDDVPVIRAAASAAFLEYVTGPIPQAQHATLRLVGGGTRTAATHLSYRAMASISIRKHLSEHHPELLEPECKVYDEKGEVDEACAGQPERLTRAYLELLGRARDRMRDQQLARALATTDPRAAADALDELLLVHEAPGDPRLIAEFFATAAEAAREDGDAMRAAQLLRKSSMLLASAEPQRSKDLRVVALLLEADTPDLDAQGRDMLLGTAAELAPASAEVEAAREDAHTSDAFAEGARVRTLYRGIPLLWGSLGCLWFLGARARGRRRR